jgi:Glyoxalase-like domain
MLLGMARLKEIVIDAAHPAALARFWAAALDGYAVRPYDEDEIARLAALGFTPETDPVVMVDGPGPTLCFQQKDAPKTARNRVHMDLIGAPRRREVARLTALGARVRDEHDGFTVMLDPEGNEFCVVDA